MHLTFTFIIYTSTPTYVSVLYKAIFKGFINFVQFTSNTNIDEFLRIFIFCGFYLYFKYWLCKLL
jgi:hypothetical protein